MRKFAAKQKFYIFVFIFNFVAVQFKLNPMFNFIQYFSRISFVLALYFATTQSSIAQISRGTEIELTDFRIPTVDYASAYNTAQKIKEQRIENCLKEILDGLIEDVQNGKAEILDFREVNSSWIQSIALLEIKSTGATRAIMIAKEKAYAFKMSKEFYFKWATSSGKGEFYNIFIRDEPEFSFRPICEILSN